MTQHKTILKQTMEHATGCELHHSKHHGKAMLRLEQATKFLLVSLDLKYFLESIFDSQVDTEFILLLSAWHSGWSKQFIRVYASKRSEKSRSGSRGWNFFICWRVFRLHNHSFFWCGQDLSSRRSCF